MSYSRYVEVSWILTVSHLIYSVQGAYDLRSIKVVRRQHILYYKA